MATSGLPAPLVLKNGLGGGGHAYSDAIGSAMMRWCRGSPAAGAQGLDAPVDGACTVWHVGTSMGFRPEPGLFQQRPARSVVGLVSPGSGHASLAGEDALDCTPALRSEVSRDRPAVRLDAVANPHELDAVGFVVWVSTQGAGEPLVDHAAEWVRFAGAWEVAVDGVSAEGADRVVCACSDCCVDACADAATEAGVGAHRVGLLVFPTPGGLRPMPALAFPPLAPSAVFGEASEGHGEAVHVLGRGFRHRLLPGE